MARPRAALLALTLACASTAIAQQTAALHAPTSAPRARSFSYMHGAVVDCAAHGAWVPPAGWTARQLPRGQVVALSPANGAALVRGVHRSRADNAAATAALQSLLGAAVSMPEATAVDPAHPRRGTLSVAHVALAGGSAEVRWYHGADRFGARDAFWIAIALTSDAAAWSAMDAARATWLQLVDHACECGYDCELRRASPPSTVP